MNEKEEKIRYCVCQEETELGIEYGISCREGECLYMAINNISPDRDFVSRMAEKFNEMQLSPGQFLDGVEDELL